jgi:hypothetical protein
MDSSQISLTELRIAAEFLDHYEIDFEEKRKSIGIHMPSLLKVLQKIPGGKNGRILVALVEDAEGKNENLTICSSVNDEDGSQFTFELGLLEMESLDMAVPDKENEVDLQISSDVFNGYVDALSTFSSTIQVTIKKARNGIKLNTVEDGSGAAFNNTNGNVVLRNMKSLKFSEDCEDDYEYNQRFALNLLISFLKGRRIFPTLSVGFNQNQPMKVEYSKLHPDTEESLIKFSFYMAPKIE